MGRVWQARDELLGRDVALKELVLPRGLTEAEIRDLRERAIREARAAARVDHPNVVRIFDVIHAQDGPWIVMELVPSRSLLEVVREDGPMAPAHAAKIGLSVLAGLRAAHRAGVLHRDVKPANVLLGPGGRVVLTDFGLATATGDSAMTSTGVVMGSPAYLAPERALDEPITPAADLWSLGATLYAAVEGRPPYDKSSPMATLAALATQPPRPPEHAGVLRPALDGLLRKNPAERIDADEAEQLLRLAADGRLPVREPAASDTRLLPVLGPPAPGIRRLPVREPAAPDIRRVPVTGSGAPGEAAGQIGREAGGSPDSASAASGAARSKDGGNTKRMRWWAAAAAGVLLIGGGVAVRPMLTTARAEELPGTSPSVVQQQSPSGTTGTAASRPAEGSGSSAALPPASATGATRSAQPNGGHPTGKTAATTAGVPVTATTEAARVPAAGGPISSFATGDCLQLDTGSGRIVLGTCNGSDAQKFDFPSDKTMRVLGRCVQIVGGDDGARLGTASCSGSAAQQWNYNSSYDLVNLQVVKCADVTDSNAADGTPAQVWECTGADNQKWHR